MKSIPLVLVAFLGGWATALLAVAGCQRTLLRHTDRSVYHVIDERQVDALGEKASAFVGEESGRLSDTQRMYRFNPHPVRSDIPESFRTNAPPTSLETGQDDDEEATDDEQPVSQGNGKISEDIFLPEERNRVRTIGLRDALAYAMRQARSLQNAKEELYIAALDLTLERHLWTPLFVASVQSTYTYSSLPSEFDAALSSVSDLAVSQRLPYGGNVTARIVNTLMQDLDEHVTTGEDGNLILDANLPLLRGAGRVAFESRYQAERQLIYAVRTYERFRRTFLVDVAARYFDLQQDKAAIHNTYTSYLSRRQDWEKADFINRMGKSKTVFDAPRAKSTLRQAEASLVSSKERYETALDRFKVFIGMGIEKLLDVVDQEADKDSTALDDLLPDVDVQTAVKVAQNFRLDLLNVADAVDDAKRGVVIAKNQILPDLDFTGQVALDSDPERLNSASFNRERATWQAGLNLRLDDRKAERNAYRQSFITLARARRRYEEFYDNVGADVRRAVRRIAQQKDLRMIQALNMKENELRWQAARAQFDLGKSSNQDVVDAENELLAARNDLAAAVAAYRNAILEFRRDTGTLRITDDGRWDPSLAVVPSDRPSDGSDSEP